MLDFVSATSRAVSAERAVLEALEAATGSTRPSCGLVLVNACVGHDVAALSQVVRAQCPDARVLATSCAGVVGREGPGESVRDLALMGVSGDGAVVAHVDGVYGSTSFAKGAELGRALAASDRPLRMVYLLASGIDIANDRLLEGLESVLGPDVVVFGATSSDQMQGVATYQAVDGVRYRHGAFAVGIWDPTLEVDTQATHGFLAAGEPLRVTAAEGNRIVELDGRPAWSVYLERLGLPPDATIAHTIPIGALAEPLPAALAAEYGNDHILRVVTQHGPRGELVYATDVAVGTELWLTVRDEARIFDDMDRMTAQMTARAGGRRPVAVFQADCLARGRRLFQRVIKEELVHRIQQPFTTEGVVPAWNGMYGFGEYARLGGRNAYHNYTTALATLLRTGG